MKKLIIILALLPVVASAQETKEKVIEYLNSSLQMRTAFCLDDSIQFKYLPESATSKLRNATYQETFALLNRILMEIYSLNQCTGNIYSLAAPAKYKSCDVISLQKLLDKMKESYPLHDLSGYQAAKDYAARMEPIIRKNDSIEFAMEKQKKKVRQDSIEKANRQSVLEQKPFEVTSKITTVDYSRKYYSGGKGGCFYYSSNGKKVYVDRSNCK